MNIAAVLILITGLGATPPQPDYSLEQNWAALPGRHDAADVVPDNTPFSDGQDTARVDVFFIHPTTYYRSYSGNADVSDERLNDYTDQHTIRTQASVFNGTARVYAPRYRQAALHNFFKRDESKSRKAFNVAYSDVKRAFEYYLQHYNNGRPVIIAGHSQGSMHGMRLVKEYFDGTSQQKKLVAAYLIGYAVPEDYFSVLPACNDPSQTGCFVSFNTFGWDADPRYQEYGGSVCVNPLNWKVDGSLEGNKAHLGGVPRNFDRVDEHMVSAKCNNGVLWITKPEANGYLMMGGKNYHLVDYQLFYKDIRVNAGNRVRNYLKKK